MGWLRGRLSFLLTAYVVLSRPFLSVPGVLPLRSKPQCVCVNSATSQLGRGLRGRGPAIILIHLSHMTLGKETT